MNIGPAYSVAETMAWRAGFDSAIHGSNIHNCNYRLFNTQEMLAAWDAGKLAGEAEMALAKELASNDSPH